MMFAVLTASGAGASEPKTSEAAHGHEDGDYGLEIAVSPALVWFPSTDAPAFGLHGHTILSIEDTGVGLGIGYEKIFGENEHSTIGLAAQYHVTDRFTLGVAPGVTFEAGDWGTPIPTLHIETNYTFDFDGFHLGPAFEWGVDPDDSHIQLGLHVAVDL